MRLNPDQEEVADHFFGRILTLAGPGSGKTKTLTERTGRLIRKGVQASSILCLTFTNKARDEMRERIAAVHGEMASKVFISNFHGLCGTILRRLGKPLGYSGSMTVVDTDDQVDLILQVARKKGLEPTKPQAKLLAMIANDLRENLAPEEDLYTAGGDRVTDKERSVVRTYFDVLRRRGQCDFSGLLSETERLLREHPDVRDRLRQKFRFIQVDEYQDTNKAQNAIVEHLAGDEDNVLAVGDADQSIYAWRGASPDAIPQFITAGKAKTGHCRIVKLGTNYRSTPQVIEVADRLIRCSADRIAVEFKTVKPPGEPVKCIHFPSPEEEAEAVAMNIETLVRKDGVPPREIAVFYRANDMSRQVEQALARRQLPYQVVGGGSYYDRMEVKDVLSMLRFVCNPKDGISFARMANKPARGMGDVLIGRIESFAEKHNIDLISTMTRAYDLRDDHDRPLGEAAINACHESLRIFGINTAGKSVAEIAMELLSRSKYDDWLKEKYKEKNEYDNRSRNVNELVNSIALFCRDNPRASIADYLQSISLYTDGDKSGEENAVRLMSLHASKGLEFDVVYMIGVEHGILPHERAVKDRGEAGLEEERRLCYVGFTRARKLLRVTWCQKRQDSFARSGTANFIASRPSRFLVESGLMSVEEHQTAVKEAVEANRPARGPKRPARPTAQQRPRP